MSLLSDRRVPIEETSRLEGHSSTAITETVYRHQLRPIIETGASAVNELFEDRPSSTPSDGTEDDNPAV